VDVDELVWLDATSLAGLIRATAVEVVQAHLDRLESVGERVNAFVTVLGEQALDAARRPAPGPLAGVPFTVKDSFATAGVRTTRGSLLFADHVPARDATAVARLRGAGAVLLGKTCLPEMSYWTETDNRLIGRTSNPYDPEPLSLTLAADERTPQSGRPEPRQRDMPRYLTSSCPPRPDEPGVGVPGGKGNPHPEPTGRPVLSPASAAPDVTSRPCGVSLRGVSPARDAQSRASVGRPGSLR